MRTTQPGFLEIQSPGFRTAIATDVTGNEKALLDTIIGAGYDVVFLPDALPKSIKKLIRMGIFCVPASLFDRFGIPAEIEANGGSGGETWVAEPMLSRSMVKVEVEEYSVGISDVERYADVSKDTNRLHFDDSYARSMGFEGRISHGMIFNGWVSRYLGTRFPGEGTIFLRNATSYFAPVYPGCPYSARISVPSMDVERGIYSILFQLSHQAPDGGRRLAMLSYNDVMLRDTAN